MKYQVIVRNLVINYEYTLTTKDSRESALDAIDRAMREDVKYGNSDEYEYTIRTTNDNISAPSLQE